MNDEAGFLAAVLAEPDERTALLVYADWLDEHNDPRAEFLRMLAARERDGARLAELYQVLDLGWTQLIGCRHLKPGARTEYKAPAATDAVLDQTTITTERPDATVRLTIRHCPQRSAFGWWELEVVKR